MKKRKAWKLLASIVTIAAIMVLTFNFHDPESQMYDFVRALGPDSESVKVEVKEMLYQSTSAKVIPVTTFERFTVRTFNFRSATPDRKAHIHKVLLLHKSELNRLNGGDVYINDRLFDTGQEGLSEIEFLSTVKASWIEERWLKFKRAIGLVSREVRVLQ